MMIKSLLSATVLGSALVLSGCVVESGYDARQDEYGVAYNANLARQDAYGLSGARLTDLSERFKAAAQDTVTFAFNKSALDATARAALDGQVKWLKENPGVRMTVIGHTDLVGSHRYNDRLGLRRARAVVRYLRSQGISRKRLDAVSSRGEREPVVQTEMRERRNRRSVTMVAGYSREFVGHGLDGVYSARVYDQYQIGKSKVSEANSTQVN